MRVLLIEDSDILRESLQKGLSRLGFIVDAVNDGKAGWTYATCNDYGAVVLDLMIPGIDGLTLLRRLRTEGHHVHVLILTARDAVEHRVEGLRAGADDYMTKPFALEELAARLEALQRRRRDTAAPVLKHGKLEVDLNNREIRFDARVAPTTRREFNLMRLLVEHQGEVLSRMQIEDQLYHEHNLPESNSVNSAICSLRRKLETLGCPKVITTRRGMGYIFNATPLETRA